MVTEAQIEQQIHQREQALIELGVLKPGQTDTPADLVTAQQRLLQHAAHGTPHGQPTDPHGEYVELSDLRDDPGSHGDLLAYQLASEDTTGANAIAAASQYDIREYMNSPLPSVYKLAMLNAIMFQVQYLQMQQQLTQQLQQQQRAESMEASQSALSKFSLFGLLGLLFKSSSGQAEQVLRQQVEAFNEAMAHTTGLDVATPIYFDNEAALQHYVEIAELIGYVFVATAGTIQAAVATQQAEQIATAVENASLSLVDGVEGLRAELVDHAEAAYVAADRFTTSIHHVLNSELGTELDADAKSVLTEAAAASPSQVAKRLALVQELTVARHIEPASLFELKPGPSLRQQLQADLQASGVEPSQETDFSISEADAIEALARRLLTKRPELQRSEEAYTYKQDALRQAEESLQLQRQNYKRAQSQHVDAAAPELIVARDAMMAAAIHRNQVQEQLAMVGEMSPARRCATELLRRSHDATTEPPPALSLAALRVMRANKVVTALQPEPESDLANRQQEAQRLQQAAFDVHQHAREVWAAKSELLQAACDQQALAPEQQQSAASGAPTPFAFKPHPTIRSIKDSESRASLEGERLNQNSGQGPHAPPNPFDTKPTPNA